MPRLGKRKRDFLQRNPKLDSKYNNFSNDANPLRVEKKIKIESLEIKINESIDIIQGLVSEIIVMMEQINPIDFLSWCFHKNMSGLVNIETESQLTDKLVLNQRVLEYVHSIIVSSPQPSISRITDGNDINKFTSIHSKIKELYESYSHLGLQKLMNYSLSHEAVTKSEISSIRLWATSDWESIRGHGYLVHQIEILKFLVHPHNSIIQKIFGISVQEFINGFINLMEFRTIYFNRNFRQKDIIDVQWKEYLDSKFLKDIEVDELTMSQEFANFLDSQGLREKFKEVCQFMDRLVFTNHDVFDVHQMSGLSIEILESFAYGVNEYEGFFDDSIYSGTPIKQLPCQKRPFIKVENKILYFDEYGIRDNFYSILQAKIEELQPSYKDKWNQLEKIASEKLVTNAFAKLLPDANLYSSAYYYDLSGNRCETDILVEFEETLLIVEVKANKINMTQSPELRFKSFIGEIDKVIKNPVEQAHRVIDVLYSKGELEIMDAKGRVLHTIRKENYSTLVAIAVPFETSTLFAFSEYLQEVGIDTTKYPTWIISINDLLVYRDIFTMPIIFNYYIRTRLDSIKSMNVVLNDELDHLGLFLNLNNVSKYAEEYAGYDEIAWFGYRDKIDKYFVNKTLGVDIPIPQLKLSIIVTKILKTLEQQKKEGRYKVGTWLLSHDCLSNENGLELISRQINKGKADASYSGAVLILEDLPIIIFYSHSKSEVPLNKQNERREYAIGTFSLLANKEHGILLLNLRGITQDKFEDVSFEFFTKESLNQYPESQVNEWANKYADSRIRTASKLEGKIKRNSKCPCGSGKKFKVCHGRTAPMNNEV